MGSTPFSYSSQLLDSHSLRHLDSLVPATMLLYIETSSGWMGVGRRVKADPQATTIKIFSISSFLMIKVGRINYDIA